MPIFTQEIALWTESPVPEKTNDLAELIRDKRPGYGQHKLTPIQKPKGIDPGIILEEGERRINARIANRITEIESQGSTFGWVFMGIF